MELNQNFTKPSIRSVLSFTEKELISALKEYAKQRGYNFAEDSEYTVWHPDLHRCINYSKLTKLVVDVGGCDAAILEGAKK